MLLLLILLILLLALLPDSIARISTADKDDYQIRDHSFFDYRQPPVGWNPLQPYFSRRSRLRLFLFVWASALYKIALRRLQGAFRTHQIISLTVRQNLGTLWYGRGILRS